MVWWRGNPNARTVLIGEGPGADEDSTGVPFVGKAGQRLDKLMKSVDIIPAEDVFITNMVLCRPPNNRTPEKDEMAACWPRLVMMLHIISPAMIVLLGATASGKVINEWVMSRSAGRFFQAHLNWRSATVITMAMPTYHPSYLLRQHDDELDKTVAGQIKSAVEFGRKR